MPILKNMDVIKECGCVIAINYLVLTNPARSPNPKLLRITQIQHIGANVDVTNVHSLFHTIGIRVNDWNSSIID